MKRWLAVCLILLASPCRAQSPPAAVSPITGPAGTYTTSVTLATYGPITLAGPWSGPAGVYTITLPAGATVVQTDTSITITWGTPTPTPVPPAPTPLTIPSGSVPTASLFVALITDPSGTLTPAQQALKDSKTIGPTLKAANATWAVADINTPTFNQWVEEVRTFGLPALLIIAVDQSNKATAHEIIKVGDDLALAAEIRRIRGK